MTPEAGDESTPRAGTSAMSGTDGGRNPKRDERTLLRARAAHQRGALAEAERGYMELLSDDPFHPEACHLLGTLRFQMGRPGEAEELIWRSISQAPSPLALANLSAVLASLGRYEDALARLDEALALNPDHPRALVQRAGVFAELGRHEDAVTAYDRLLAQAPTFADGYAWRAAALRSITRHAEALTSCERALNLDARSFEALKEHGNVLRDMARHDEALGSYQRALAVKPGDIDVLFRRGLALLDLNRLEPALSSFNEAIASAPRLVSAIYNSAVVLERLGRLEEALARCDRVIDLDAAHAKAYANRGNVLQSLGRNGQAVESYAKALALEPDGIEVLCNQASALRYLGRRDEALLACERALALGGDGVASRFARGRALQALHRYDDALMDFDRVLAIQPENKIAHFQRGNTLRDLRRHEEAKHAYGQAIALDPEYVHAHCMRAFLCLTVADFSNGWEEYEWRWRDSNMSGAVRNFVQPRWNGREPLIGKTILLYVEQGLGDTLQFCRYLVMVKALGATVVLEAQVELQSVLATLSGVDVLVRYGEPLPPFDFHCPLLSLPHAFGTDLHTIPSGVPYLSVDTRLRQKWQDKLGPRSRPRIGIVWSGNPKHLNDHNRSIGFDSLSPMMSDAYEWISLQKVIREDERDAVAASQVRHFGDDIEDFSDTAALLQEVDCLLSVDTSVAHLAGALGRPLWLMLPYTPDFRWLLDRDDSPWYPQARLFRQTSPGEWSDVFEQIRLALPEIEAHAM
ncbi:tetratricopeptide repeat protein [Paraburkholderia jirisanensis]